MSTTQHPTDLATWTSVQLAAASADLEVTAQKADLAGRYATAARLRDQAAPYRAEIQRRK